MLLDDVYIYLIAQSTSFTGGAAGDIGKGIMLDETTDVADTFTSLYETGGQAPLRTFSTGGSVLDHERPSIQVLARSTSYSKARLNANNAWTALDGASGVINTTAGTTYLSITADQSPFSIGRDKNERFLISCNYTVWKR